MTRVEILLLELTHEIATTRKHLERVPPDKFEWRPHPKSFTSGQLASHIVDCIRWVPRIFTADAFNVDTRTFTEFEAAHVEALLAEFDREASEAKRALASAPDTSPQDRGGS